MNEVSTQMVEVMSAKVIEAIDGYPADADEKRAIASAVAERIAGAEYE